MHFPRDGRVLDSAILKPFLDKPSKLGIEPEGITGAGSGEVFRDV